MGEPLATIASEDKQQTLIAIRAGVNRESNQESWISNLNRCGVPVTALDPWYNTDYGIRKTLEDFQQLLDMGKLRIHRKRAGVFWDAIEGWQFKAPEGVPLPLLELARLKPRKDRHSHPGDTGRYGSGAIRRLLRRPGTSDPTKEILSRLLLTRKRSGLDRLPARDLGWP